MSSEDDFLPKVWGDVAKAAVGLSQVRAIRALTRDAEFQAGDNANGTAEMTGQFAAVYTTGDEDTAPATYALVINTTRDFQYPGGAYGVARDTTFAYSANYTGNFTRKHTEYGDSVNSTFATYRIASPPRPAYRHFGVNYLWAFDSNSDSEYREQRPPTDPYDYLGSRKLYEIRTRFDTFFRAAGSSHKLTAFGEGASGQFYATLTIPSPPIFYGHNTATGEDHLLWVANQTIEGTVANDLWWRRMPTVIKFSGNLPTMVPASILDASVGVFAAPPNSSGRHVYASPNAGVCARAGIYVFMVRVASTPKTVSGLRVFNDPSPPFAEYTKRVVVEEVLADDTAANLYVAVYRNWGNTIQYFGDKSVWLPNDRVGIVGDYAYTNTFETPEQNVDLSAFIEPFYEWIVATTVMTSVTPSLVLITYIMPVYESSRGSLKTDFDAQRGIVGHRCVAKIVDVDNYTAQEAALPVPAHWGQSFRVLTTTTLREGVVLLQCVPIPQHYSGGPWEDAPDVGLYPRRMERCFVRGNYSSGWTWTLLEPSGLPSVVFTNHEVAGAKVELLDTGDSGSTIGLCVYDAGNIELYTSADDGDSWQYRKVVGTISTKDAVRLMREDTTLILKLLYLSVGVLRVDGFAGVGIEAPWTKRGI